MYTKQSKKLIIMNILDILKKYTDEDHRLSQKEIHDMLRNDYYMDVERKAIKGLLRYYKRYYVKK